jgi:hypothetical protein
VLVGGITVTPVIRVGETRDYWYKDTLKGRQEQYQAWWKDQESRYRYDLALRRMDTLERNMETAALLRRVTLLERQEQTCELCGYRFNYKTDGTPKAENDWCRADKNRCDTHNGWQICLDNQERDRKAKQRRDAGAVTPERKRLREKGDDAGKAGTATTLTANGALTNIPIQGS